MQSNKHYGFINYIPLCMVFGMLSAECLADDGAAEASAGYNQIMTGKLPAAETTFQKMADSSNIEVAIKGQEGLAETHWHRGKIEEASMLVEKVLKKSPKRAMARLIKAKVLYKKGRKKEAETELVAAAKGKSDFRWQKAAVHTAKGNIYRKQKQPKLAVAAYKEALAEQPDDLNALNNLGVTLQESGEPEEAVKAFSKLKQQHPHDALASALLRQAQEAIQQKQDIEKQRYIDGIVKDLLAAYRQQSQAPKSADDWTSSAMAISILGFQDRNDDDLSERVGVEAVLQEELTQQLQAANVKVVERAVLDKVLAELKLGGSELADQDTALKLGKILAARLIATGSLLKLGDDESMVNVRLIDTETTDIVSPLSEKQAGNIDAPTLAGKFAKSIAATIKDKYPMKGRIAMVEGDSVIINLGKKHNVSPGMVFNILGGKEEPIELNGRILGYRQSKAGQLEVSKVEDLMSYAKPLQKVGDLEKNQKIIQQQ
jgi:Tfp pilus assembly protein PilF